MKTSVSLVLELCRILLIAFMGLIVLWKLETSLYKQLSISLDPFATEISIANFIILFILYRNFLQFYGFYKSKVNTKIPKIPVILLIVISSFLLLFPLIESKSIAVDPSA